MSQARRGQRRQSGLAPASPTLRLVAAALMVPALGMLLVAASALTSELYSGISRSIMQGLRWKLDPATLSAEAVALTPWRSETRLLAAQITSTSGRMADASDIVAQAALESPGDARVWVYWARLRGAADRYDASLTEGYRLASNRAPYARNIQESIATDAVFRWRHGDEELRGIWTSSIAYALYRDPKPFLLSIVRSGRDPYFCATVGQRLPLEQWCDLAGRARTACLAPRVDAKTAQWCRQVGFPVAGAADELRPR